MELYSIGYRKQDQDPGEKNYYLSLSVICADIEGGMCEFSAGNRSHSRYVKKKEV